MAGGEPSSHLRDCLWPNHAYLHIIMTPKAARQGESLGRHRLKFAGAMNPAVLASRPRLLCLKHFPVAAKVI